MRFSPLKTAAVLQDPPIQPCVAIVRCEDYTPQRVTAAVAELIQAIADPASLLAAGPTVLIKPNLLTDAAPEQAKTTHPEVVRAMIRLLREHGATVSVGDSPASAAKLSRVWEKSGYEKLCAAEGAAVIRFEQHPTRPLRCGHSVLNLAEPVLNADLVVNIPKVKTHILTTFTGAVKNLYGVLPGYQKTILHRAYPTPSQFGRLPAALYARIRPRLNLADAIVAMEGAGPSGGDPIRLGFLAASTDAVALDTALCSVLGINVRRLPWRRYLPPECAEALNPESIQYPLLRPRDVKPPRFRIPNPLWPRLIPGPLVRRLGKLAWIRPRFEPACVRCGRCVKACCNQALRLEATDPRPVLIPERCVACCCCHEVCPERAVTMHQSPLLHWIRRGRLP